MDKNQKLAKEIYQAVGGQENVNKIIHCMLVCEWILKIVRA